MNKVTYTGSIQWRNETWDVEVSREGFPADLKSSKAWEKFVSIGMASLLEITNPDGLYDSYTLSEVPSQPGSSCHEFLTVDDSGKRRKIFRLETPENYDDCISLFDKAVFVTHQLFTSSPASFLEPKSSLVEFSQEKWDAYYNMLIDAQKAERPLQSSQEAEFVFRVSKEAYKNLPLKTAGECVKDGRDWFRKKITPSNDTESWFTKFFSFFKRKKTSPEIDQDQNAFVDIELTRKAFWEIVSNSKTLSQIFKNLGPNQIENVQKGIPQTEKEMESLLNGDLSGNYRELADKANKLSSLNDAVNLIQAHLNEDQQKIFDSLTDFLGPYRTSVMNQVKKIQCETVWKQFEKTKTPSLEKFQRQCEILKPLIQKDGGVCFV